MPADEDAHVPKKIITVGGLLAAIQDLKKLLINNKWVADRAKADRVRFWLRGHAKEDWSLFPKGLREPKPFMRAMLHEFRAEATILHDSAPEHRDLRQWLFLMQHYGMPTLLLDWTRSALAALAFALEIERDRPEWDQQDGSLWILRPGKWNELSNAIPYAVLDAYSSDLDDLFAVHFDQDASKRLTCPKSRAVTAVEPVFNSRRMIAQQGVFTIHGPTSKPMEKVALGSPEQCLWKLIVPKDRKAVLRQELHDLGIQPSSLFPDLDHLSACITRRYGGGRSTTGAEKARGGEDPGEATPEHDKQDDMVTDGAPPSP
jgi:hypothetical protein